MEITKSTNSNLFWSNFSRFYAKIYQWKTSSKVNFSNDVC